MQATLSIKKAVDAPSWFAARGFNGRIPSSDHLQPVHPPLFLKACRHGRNPLHMMYEHVVCPPTMMIREWYGLRWRGFGSGQQGSGVIRLSLTVYDRHSALHL